MHTSQKHHAPYHIYSWGYVNGVLAWTDNGTIKGEAGIKTEIEHIKHEIERAQREYNLELAAKLQYGKLPELEEEQPPKVR